MSDELTTVSGSGLSKDSRWLRLCVPYLDVGWVPLFVHAGAVISAAGGVLSPETIVEREYGVPAIVSIHSISDPAVVTKVAVHGFKGQVLIIQTQH